MSKKFHAKHNKPASGGQCLHVLYNEGKFDILTF